MSSRSARNVAFAAASGLMAGPLVGVVGPAVAIPPPPEPTVTDVTSTIHEISFPYHGSHTFIAPAGVTKVAAIIVGAGGGGSSYYGAYAGGGGEVLFVDSVDVTSPVTFTVGSGGTSSSVGVGGNGGESLLGSHTARGGHGGDSSSQVGGDSGNGLDGSSYYGGIIGAGGGAGGAAYNVQPGSPEYDENLVCTAGSGLTASAVAGGSSLFPALLGEPEYGVGGDCTEIQPTSLSLAAGHGGDVYTGPSPDYETLADDGTDGAVIFRWSDALPDTGLNVQPWMIGAGMGIIVAGALLTSGLLRVRRKGRHAA